MGSEREERQMKHNNGKPSLRRALDAFFFGFAQAFNVSGSVVNRGRFGRGFAGDAEALAGDWQRSLARADAIVRNSASTEPARD
jgi:hypothetical protein